MSGPVVFISYSHDSEEHREKVLGLAARLRQDGLETRLDQQVNGTPEQGWPRWMLDQLDEAAFVLVVCTPTYYRRFRGHEEAGRGKGASWEGSLITQEIYDSKSRTKKFVPVMLSGGQEFCIPEPLRAHTHYQLTSEEGYQALYAFLLGQAGADLGPVGAVKPVTRRAAQPLTFATPSRPTMIGVPHRNTFFTGREALLALLHQQLQRQGISALAQAAIHGLGGIGKTQMAIEYAYRFSERYRYILWAIAEEEAAIAAAYLAIARELGLIDAQADLETAVLAVKAWLSREAGWLLVFDNADDPALVRSYLPSLRSDGKVLLTSRAKSFATVGVKDPFRLETMDPEDAVRFLIERTRNKDARAAADLARELGYLPLALEQAAAYIETVGGDFTEYLARYRRQGVALLERGEPSTEYPGTVATTWTLSFDAVRHASPASAEILTAAAFLAPDSIPIELFTLGAPELGPSLARELEGADKDPLLFRELVAHLEGYSLVERLPEDAFKLHRLTQEVVKDSLGEEGRRTWAERIVRALNAAHPRAAFENRKLCERLQPHVRQASELTRTYRLESAEAGRIFFEAGAFASERGDYASARFFEELSLEIRQRVSGGEHPETLTARNNLAVTLRALGDLLAARGLHEQNLKIRKSVLGEEHPDTLQSIHNLAATLRKLGDLTGSRELHEQSLTTQKRLLGVEHPDTLESMSSLGWTLQSLGDYPGARALFEQTLDIRKRLLGDEHPDTLQSMNNLGLNLRGLGHLAESRKLLERTLESQERVLGREHPDTLGSRHNLALTLSELRDFAGARRLQEQSLEIRKRILGNEHPETTLSAWNLLCTVHRLKDTKAKASLIEDLRWLLDREESSLPSPQHKHVRRELLKLLKSNPRKV